MCLFMYPSVIRNVRFFGFIRNNTLLTCGQCVHSFYDTRDDHKCSSRLSKCILFGEKNLQHGRVEHDYTEVCRNDESKCGLNAKYFKLDMS
jgi:hypothetical protein